MKKQVKKSEAVAFINKITKQGYQVTRTVNNGNSGEGYVLVEAYQAKFDFPGDLYIQVIVADDLNSNYLVLRKSDNRIIFNRLLSNLVEPEKFLNDFLQDRYKK